MEHQVGMYRGSGGQTKARFLRGLLPTVHLGGEVSSRRPAPTPHSSALCAPDLSQTAGPDQRGSDGPGGQGTCRHLPGLGSRSSSSAVPRVLKPGGSAGPIRSLAIRDGGHWSQVNPISSHQIYSKSSPGRSADAESLPAPTNDVTAFGWLSREIRSNGSDV